MKPVFRRLIETVESREARHAMRSLFDNTIGSGVKQEKPTFTVKVHYDPTWQILSRIKRQESRPGKRVPVGGRKRRKKRLRVKWAMFMLGNVFKRG